jgi:hypothetical protein
MVDSTKPTVVYISNLPDLGEEVLADVFKSPGIPFIEIR